MVVPHEPQKLPDLSDYDWQGPVCHSLYLFGVHPQSTSSHDDSQVVNLFLLKGALFGLQIKVMLFEDIQDEVDVCPVPPTVLLFCLSRSALGVDGDIVHIHGEPSLSHLFPEDGVHHHLECGRGIGEAEEHYCGFKEPFWDKEGGFLFIPWFNSDVIVPPVDIELHEEGAATEVINGLQD
jgi:hypothetical protein